MAAESSRELVRALYAETVGTFLFQLLGGSEQAAVYNGLLLTVCIVITAKASGGNLNPAVSLALVVVGAMTPFKCALYCLVQVLGQGSHTTPRTRHCVCAYFSLWRVHCVWCRSSAQFSRRCSLLPSTSTQSPSTLQGSRRGAKSKERVCHPDAARRCLTRRAAPSS